MKFGVIIVTDGQTRFTAAVATLRAEADHVMAIQNMAGDWIEGASVQNPHPLSFAENLNLGWQVFSNFGAVVICNPDIIVPAGWREPLEKALKAKPKLGAVSLPSDKPLRRPGLSRTTPLIFTAIRRSAVTWFPPFDERLVNACEDLDISHRLESEGWLHEFVDGPEIIHDTELSRLHSFKSGVSATRSQVIDFDEIYGPGIGDALMKASG